MVTETKSYARTPYGRLIRLSVPYQGSRNEEDAIDVLCKSRLESNRFACLVSITVILIGIIADAIYYPEHFYTFLAVRSISLGVLIFTWITQMGWNDKRWSLIPLNSFLIVNSVTLIVAIMVYIADGAHSPYFSGFILVLIGMAFIMRVAPIEIAVYSIYICVIYSLSCYLNHINFLSLPSEPTGTVANGSFMGMIVSVESFIIGLFFIIVSAGLAYVGARITIRESYFRLVQESLTRDAQEDLQYFVAMITHEIKTPVQYLATFSDYIANADDNKDRSLDHDLRQGIKLQSARLLNQLKKLVQLTSNTSGSDDLPTAEDQKSYLDTTLHSLMIETLAACRVRGLYLINKTTPNNYREIVPLSSDDVYTVLGNTITNAIKFTEAGGSLTISKYVDVKSSLVKIIVEDTGMGMSEFALQDLFKAFRQGENRTSFNEQWSGMGLGMHLAFNAIERVGGSISTESEIGIGTRITIAIPAKIEARSFGTAAEQPVAETARRQIIDSISDVNQINDFAYPAKSNSQAGSKAPQILLVDDEPSIHQSFAHILSDYLIIHATSGEQAINALSRENIDLIILDVMLPQEDGIEVLRKIRASEDSVPVLISSALLEYGTKTLLEEAIENGANDVVNKPVEETELKMRVKSLTKTSHLTKELNIALEELRAMQDQIIQSEKLTSISYMADGLLHNLGNPVYQASTMLRALREKTEQQAQSPYWDDLEDSLRMVTQIISDLKRYSHPGENQSISIDLRHLFDQALIMSGVNHDMVNMTLEVDSINGNYNDILQIMITLISNSRDAVEQIDKPEITITSAPASHYGVFLSICDNGSGIDPHQPIFKPHFTTKPAGKGTGLGLYVASILCAKNSFTIDYCPRHPAGTCFTLLMPNCLTKVPS